MIKISDYIDLKDLKKHQQTVKVKKFISTATSPVTKSYKGLKDILRKREEKHRAQQLIMQDIKNKLAGGKLQSVKAIEDVYGYGTQKSRYAINLFRQKQLADVREQAMFKARKKVVTKKAKEMVLGKPRPKVQGQQYDPMQAFAFGAPAAPAARSIKRRPAQAKHKKGKQKPKVIIKYRNRPQQNQQAQQKAEQQAKFNKMLWDS